MARNYPKRCKLGKAPQKAAHVKVGQTVTKSEADRPLRSCRQERAAVALAQALLPETHLAVVLGASRRTLFRWRQNPSFMARVEFFQAQIAAAELQRVIEESRTRVAGQDREVREFQVEAAARAAGGTDEAVRQLEEMHDRQARQAIATARRASPVVPVQFRQAPAPTVRTPWENYIFGEPREPRCLNAHPTLGNWRRD